MPVEFCREIGVRALSCPGEQLQYIENGDSFWRHVTLVGACEREVAARIFPAATILCKSDVRMKADNGSTAFGWIVTMVVGRGTCAVNLCRSSPCCVWARSSRWAHVFANGVDESWPNVHCIVCSTYGSKFALGN